MCTPSSPTKPPCLLIAVILIKMMQQAFKLGPPLYALQLEGDSTSFPRITKKLTLRNIYEMRASGKEVALQPYLSLRVLPTIVKIDGKVLCSLKRQPPREL